MSCRWCLSWEELVNLLHTTVHVWMCECVCKNNMNKGTIGSVCMKIFLLHECRLKLWSLPYRTMIFSTCKHISWQKTIKIQSHNGHTAAAFYLACLWKLHLESLFFKLSNRINGCSTKKPGNIFTFSCSWQAD